MLLDPLGDLGKMLVLLANVVTLAQVDQEDDWLGTEQEQWVDNLDLRTIMLACRSTQCFMLNEGNSRVFESEKKVSHDTSA